MGRDKCDDDLALSGLVLPRVPKVRDMILDTAVEEIGHVEMLATMIARLLESSPVEAQEALAKNSLVGA
jgi:Mn-containing catalase